MSNDLDGSRGQTSLGNIAQRILGAGVRARGLDDRMSASNTPAGKPVANILSMTSSKHQELDIARLETAACASIHQLKSTVSPAAVELSEIADRASIPKLCRQ